MKYRLEKLAIKKKKKLTKTFQKQKELQESRSNQLPGFKLVFLDPFLNSP